MTRLAMVLGVVLALTVPCSAPPARATHSEASTPAPPDPGNLPTCWPPGMEPDVLITAPLSGSTVRAALVTPVAVNLSGGLTGVAKITLHVNGAQKATDLSSPYGFSWKPAGSLVGTEPVLEVRAWNSKAMVVATDRITVLVLGRD